MTNMDLEKKVLELEKRVEKLEKERINKNKTWIISLLGWLIFIILIIIAWTKIYPLIQKYSHLVDNINGATNMIKKGAVQGNELIDKVNHPIKNIEKFNPF